jgi:RNA polymerase sigma-70 factor (ECF subfamily)
MDPATNLRDDDLLRRMIAGDEEAFTVLYRRRQGGIYRFALHMSGTPSIAEEVTQEVFLVLLREARQFDPQRGSVSAFLFGIARNHVLRCLERDRRYVALAGDGEQELPRAIEGAWAAPGNFVDGLMRAETIELVRRAVLALPANYREAVVLCDLEEMDYREAAQALGCAVGTVRSRLHRGRALLLEKLRTAPFAVEQRPTARQARGAR